MPIHRFHLVAALTFTLALAVASAAQSPPSGGDAKKDAVNNSDLELVERLIIARREYQRMLEQLRAHYMTAGDLERTRHRRPEALGRAVRH